MWLKICGIWQMFHQSHFWPYRPLKFINLPCISSIYSQSNWVLHGWRTVQRWRWRKGRGAACCAFATSWRRTSSPLTWWTTWSVMGWWLWMRRRRSGVRWASASPGRVMLHNSEPRLCNTRLFFFPCFAHSTKTDSPNIIEIRFIQL